MDASGGALDTSSNFQSGSSGSSHSKVTAFSATLTDGLAQAVAQEAGKFYSYRFVNNFFRCLDPLICIVRERYL